MKRFNSKAFLIFYLAIIGMILLVWLSRLNLPAEEKRNIPAELRSYLVSPVRPLPQILLHDQYDEVFTNASLEGRWTFVYFTQGHCLPYCASIFSKLKSLKRDLASRTINFVLINYDPHPSSIEALKASSESTVFSILSADKAVIEKVTQTFNFLYLKSYTDEGYYFEQEHLLYLVDPQGRYYAYFDNDMALPSLIKQFSEIRYFYAKSE